MSHLSVIRHSLTIANEQGLLMGSVLNSPLSEKGRALARAKGLTLKASGYIPDKVYTSKLLRTKQTAEIILNTLGSDIQPVELEWLIERDFGKYDGRPLQELLDGFDEYGPNPPTIETVEHFVERIRRGLERIKQESNSFTLIVTHSNTINVMKAVLFNPKNVQRYWETDNPEYCEGFDHIF
jgi:broad specificity phosphatase PhoE